MHDERSSRVRPLVTDPGTISRRCLLRGAALALSAAAAAAALAACGGSTAAPSPSGPTSGAATAPPTTGTTAASSAVRSSSGNTTYKLDLGGYKGPALTSQSIKLRFTRQVYTPATEQYFKDVYAQWASAYPNITFAEETVPYGDLNQKLQTYVAAGDPPDIIMGKGDFAQSYVFNKIALNLSDFLTDEYINDIPQSMRNQQSVAGKLYGMPWEQGHALLYFNKDLFAKAGVTAPPETDDLSKAWTWDQAAEAWDKMTMALSPAGSPTVFAIASSEYGNGGPGSSYWYEGIYIRGQGDPNAPKDSTSYKTFAGISDDGLTASGYVDTPEAIQGMQIYQNEFKKKYTPSVAVSRGLEDEKAATRFASITAAYKFRDPATGVKFNWGVAPIPRGKIFFNHISGDSPIASAKTKYPAETAAFLAFLCNDPNRLAFHKVWGSMPARQSLFAKIPEYTQYPQSLAVATTQAGYAPPATPGYLEYFSAMNDAVKDIAQGADVASRLHKAAKDIDGLLSKYKK